MLLPPSSGEEVARILLIHPDSTTLDIERSSHLPRPVFCPRPISSSKSQVPPMPSKVLDAQENSPQSLKPVSSQESPPSTSTPLSHLYHSPSSMKIHLRALKSAEYCSYPPGRGRSVYLNTAEKQNPRFDKRPLPKGARCITWERYVIEAERARISHEAFTVATIARFPPLEGNTEYSASRQPEGPKEKFEVRPLEATPQPRFSSSNVLPHLESGRPPAILRWLTEPHVNTTHSSIFDSIWIEPPVSARLTDSERKELRRVWKIRARTQKHLLRPGLSFPNDANEESTKVQILAQEMFAPRTQVKCAGVVGHGQTGKKPSKFADFCWQRKARIETTREQAVMDTFMGRDHGWDGGRMVLS